jgi:hypothetical protein
LMNWGCSMSISRSNEWLGLPCRYRWPPSNNVLAPHHY